jgi:hypothetical protein
MRLASFINPAHALIIMTTPEGYFVDWDGNIRLTTDPGGGYTCDVDTVAKYVGVMTKNGTLAHEATFYKNLEAIARAGIKAELVPGSQPWGKPEAG